MGSDLRERITDQFSYRGERADVWRAFDLFLDTDEFLNLGYSPRYRPHVLGSSQRRLADRVGRTVADRLGTTTGRRLLDVGCGRGGPAIHVAAQFGFRVTGIDLVPYNVARARENASEHGVDAAFVVGDATQLPVAPGTVAACTAVDALVYFPDRPAVFAAVADALEPGGVLVCSDLVARPDLDDAAAARVRSFAAAWDMPAPGTVADYERALADVGIEPVESEDISAHSVGRFRRWTTLYIRLSTSPAGRLLDRALRRYGLDPAVLETQVRRAHEALPVLRHVVVVGRKPRR